MNIERSDITVIGQTIISAKTNLRLKYKGRIIGKISLYPGFIWDINGLSEYLYNIVDTMYNGINEPYKIKYNYKYFVFDNELHVQYKDSLIASLKLPNMKNAESVASVIIRGYEEFQCYKYCPNTYEKMERCKVKTNEQKRMDGCEVCIYDG